MHELKKHASHVTHELSAILEAVNAFKNGDVTKNHQILLKRYGGVTLAGDIDTARIAKKLGIAQGQVTHFLEAGVSFAEADPTSRLEAAIIVRHGAEESHERDEDGLRGRKTKSGYPHGRGQGMLTRFSPRHSDTNN